MFVGWGGAAHPHVTRSAAAEAHVTPANEGALMGRGGPQLNLWTRLQNANGWQRIWLVLVMLALLASYPFALSLAVKHSLSYEPDVWTGFGNPECAPVLAMPAGTELTPAPGYDSPCSSLHTYRSVHDDAAATPSGYLQHIVRDQDRYAREALPWLIAAIAVSAGILYGAGLVVGWIRRGFNKERR